MLARFDDRTLTNKDQRMPRAVLGSAQPGPFAPLPAADRLRIDYGSPAPGALERTLADAAALLASAEPGTIDAAIAECFAQMARLLVLTRVQLFTDIGREGALPSHAWPNATDTEGLNLTTLPCLKGPLAQHGAAWFGSHDDVPSLDQRDLLTRRGIVAAAAVPVSYGRGRVGALVMTATTGPRTWPAAVIDSLRTFGSIVGQALATRASHLEARSAQEQVQQLRALLAGDRDETRPSVTILRTSNVMVSESAVIQQTVAQAEQVAASNATVLLMGETGVGKEVVAQMIHRLSPRHHRPMVSVSCGAIPSALIESELFGRERGAYTGALTRQIGRFEAANQSTLFLDEIGELSAEVQIKLLRVLQERVIERLGSTQQIRVDVRIIAATNRNLAKAVEDGTFREDLFYRLNVFPITVPPLRDRIEDIPGLVWDFIDEFSKALGKSIESISEESMRQLRLYPWPGNVRELRNVIERAVIVATGPRLTVSLPDRSPSRTPLSSMSLKTLETEHIRETLERTHWRIRGRGGAAERLGLKPTTLEGRMAKLGLTRPRHL
jgi:transcriptional regulator with GAF, ATPase, and Fis domain